MRKKKQERESEDEDEDEDEGKSEVKSEGEVKGGEILGIKILTDKAKEGKGRG